MSEALVLRASIIMVFTMRMTGASPADSAEASIASSFSSADENSISVSCPFMMFSIARAGFAASSCIFRRPSASSTSFSGATHDQIRPPAARVTSSCEGRSNGSANAIVSRPHVFIIGNAFAFIQKASGLVPSSSFWQT